MDALVDLQIVLDNVEESANGIRAMEGIAVLKERLSELRDSIKKVEQVVVRLTSDSDWE